MNTALYFLAASSLIKNYDDGGGGGGGGCGAKSTWGPFVGKKVEKLFCTSRARKSFDKWRWLHWR